MSKNRTRTRSRALLAACLAALVGCSVQPSAPESRATLDTRPLPAEPPAGAALATSLTVDVDPVRGAAFERPTRALQAVAVDRVLRLMVEFPQVTHDPATGRTTVTMALTNAGDSLNYLACRVGGERRVISPAWQWNTSVSKTGQTQSVPLVFDNPGGGGFTIELTFIGIMAATASVRSDMPPASPAPATPTPSATATPSAAPSPTPSATATPAATPTPTAAPTATPTPAPGVWVATASSTYGGLSPAQAIDGDPASAWANDGYQAPSAWLAIDTGGSRSIGAVSAKIKPQTGGGSFSIEVSENGSDWLTASGPHRSSTWNVTEYRLPAGTRGRHVRFKFTNDPASPEVRFAVYHVLIDGASASASTTPTPVPTATPTPAPTSPPAAGVLVNDFEQYTTGSDPRDFIDPLDEGWAFSWMPRVTWRVTLRDGSQQYMHDGLSNTANLSFRRWRGTALGTSNGELPAKYFAEVDVTPIQSYTYAPTGDQGTQFYYIDPKNYVELLIKPNLFEVWSASDAEPFQSRGWARLYYSNVNTAAGQKRKLGAEVDAVAGTMKVWLDGTLLTTVTSGVLTDRRHWFALRGTGNIVTHDNLRIEPR